MNGFLAIHPQGRPGQKACAVSFFFSKTVEPSSHIQT